VWTGISGVLRADLGEAEDFLRNRWEVLNWRGIGWRNGRLDRRHEGHTRGWSEVVRRDMGLMRKESAGADRMSRAGMFQIFRQTKVSSIRGDEALELLGDI
jgi:hypothetical protein